MICSNLYNSKSPHSVGFPLYLSPQSELCNVLLKAIIFFFGIMQARAKPRQCKYSKLLHNLFHHRLHYINNFVIVFRSSNGQFNQISISLSFNLGNPLLKIGIILTSGCPGNMTTWTVMFFMSKLVQCRRNRKDSLFSQNLRILAQSSIDLRL